MDSGIGGNQERTVSAVHIHPDYNSKTMTDDMALVRVSPPFHLDITTRLACLTSWDYLPAEGNKCFLSGWGKATANGKPCFDT